MPRGIAVVGPTTAGKSAVAAALAARIAVEIISVDSRQVYRGLDIGTAKPTADDRRAISHHGIDLVDPDERYSAGRFARDARRWFAEIERRDRVPVLVGGTGFFLRALTHPMFREPPLPADAREPLRGYLGALPEAERLRWLDALDPESAAKLGKGGGEQRQARALEVALLSGRPLSWWQMKAPGGAGLPLLVCAVDAAQDELAARIRRRFEAMIAAGLPEEVRALAGRWGTDAPAFRTTGYAEFIPWLDGAVGLEEAAEAAIAATRRLARRQRTWFRHQLPRDTVRLDGTVAPARNAERIVAAWQNATARPQGRPEEGHSA
ncbi:MAG TPA: tRNA (adenosine(37)-N6)-dimethylallyltransferase MiaA [Longimicrobiales bacterium]|nr:tRNA (adenosine(37)-N6)-dimethylallyltransferase MiaA [Longimicrobiales bacterium]